MNTAARLLVPFLKPIQPLLDDPSVTEIMVTDGGQRVFFEKGGSIVLSGGVYDAEDLRTTIETLAGMANVVMSEAEPLLETRLPDGSRVSAAIPPCSTGGDVLTIRRFGRRYTLDDWVDMGACSERECFTLRLAGIQRKNILVAGGTGSGKTTLLNAIGGWIPTTTRIVLIEDIAEIFFEGENQSDHASRPHIVRLQASETISIKSLMRHALRQRPDSLILGEVRTPSDAFELLQVFNSGHQGSMSTLHANSAIHAITRFAHLLIGAGIGLSVEEARHAILDVVDLVVHLKNRKINDILNTEAERS